MNKLGIKLYINSFDDDKFKNSVSHYGNFKITKRRYINMNLFGIELFKY
jgi:hypothetical protein